LTQDKEPVPEPKNEDQQHHPPTKMSAVVNHKFVFNETFDRLLFTGTTEKMPHTHSKGASLNRKKTKRKRKHWPTRKHHVSAAIKPRLLGGPNMDLGFSAGQNY
jgi:hypothetical protein